MSITVNFGSYEEMIVFARQLLGTTATKQETPIKKQELESESKKEMENVPEGNDEVPFEEEPVKTYTLEEVRAELAKLTRAGKQKEVKELLTSFGAKNLSSVDPKDYAALMEKAGAL